MIVNAVDLRRDGVVDVTLNKKVDPPFMDMGAVTVPLLATILKSVARPTVGADEALHDITQVIATPTRAGLPVVQLSDESVVGISVMQATPR